MFRFPVEALTSSQLRGRITPEPVAGGNLQAEAWMLYDTLNYVSATTVELTFFQQLAQDKTISNMEGPGQLPSPQYFIPFFLSWDPLVEPAIAAAPTAIRDYWRLKFGGRATWTLRIAGKDTGPFPVSTLGPSGSIGGFGYADAGVVGTNAHEYATGGMPGSGWWFDGATVLPPKENFALSVRWAAAQTITTDPTEIRAGMIGSLHRRIH